MTRAPVCTIVGAGSGLGLALARRFGRAGYRLGLIAREERRLTALAAALGTETTMAAADAGDPDALARGLDAVGPSDVLIYNAAVLNPRRPLDLTPAALDAEWRVNVAGAHAAVRHAAPHMLARGRGAILFTGGGLALEPYPEWTSLALGKAALRSFALSLYKELSPQGIGVSVVAICGIVKPGGPFDPDLIAQEYFRLATAHRGLADREIVFRPPGTDPFYNDPERRHRATTPAEAGAPCGDADDGGRTARVASLVAGR